VSHAAAGGRKVYEITEAGGAELAQRAGELAELEREIHASVADLTSLASEIDRQVSGSVRDIKRELREAAKETRRPSWTPPPRWTPPPSGELERVLGELSAEVRRLAYRRGVGDGDRQAALATLTRALEELRRLAD
jgi:hypothetical protein